MKKKSILDEVSEMTNEEFEKLSDKKKLEWLEAFQQEIGKIGVLLEPANDPLKKPGPTP